MKINWIIFQYILLGTIAFAYGGMLLCTVYVIKETDHATINAIVGHAGVIGGCILLSIGLSLKK